MFIAFNLLSAKVKQFVGVTALSTSRVPGIELGSSGLAAGTFTSRVISLARVCLFKSIRNTKSYVRSSLCGSQHGAVSEDAEREAGKGNLDEEGLRAGEIPGSLATFTNIYTRTRLQHPSPSQPSLHEDSADCREALKHTCMRNETLNCRPSSPHHGQLPPELTSHKKKPQMPSQDLYSPPS